MLRNIYSSNYLRFYGDPEGGDPDPGANPNGGYGNDGTGGKPPEFRNPNQPAGNPPPGPKTISYDEHEAMLKATQEKLTAIERAHTQKLIEIQKQLQGSESERNKAMEELKAFRQSKMTAEEIAAQKIREEKELMSADLEKYKGQAGEWENRFKSTQIKSQIMSAAMEAEAINPNQIYSILSMSAKLVERFDDEGKPTGEFEVMVPTSTKNGVVDMPIKNHLEALKKDETNGNLFKGTGNGGFGTRPNSRGKPGNVLDGSVDDMLKEFQKLDNGAF